MSNNVIVLGMSNALAVKLNNYGEPEIVRDPNEDLDRVECVVLPASDSDGYSVGKSAREDGGDESESIRVFFADGKSEASEECLVAVFQYILEYARMNGEDFSKALICCPSSFNHSIIHAAAINAGIHAKADCNEFISDAEAVLAYCRHDPALQHSNTLVCDLGGARLDVYLLQTDDLFNAIDEGFINLDLGGNQWTNAMKQLLLDKVVEETGFASDELDDETIWEIENLASSIKERLSTKDSVQLKMRIYDEPYRLTINRSEFEEYATGFVDAMQHSITTYVNDAGWEFDHILLLGGSSKMPMIRDAIEKAYPGKRIISDNGCILAYGAAYAVNS